MKLPLLALSLVFTTFAYAAPSERVYTCKGHSEERYFENFRVNILKNADNSFKATLSSGFTTQNTSETWKVSVKDEGSSVVINGLNKTFFKLLILKNEKAAVDDIYGMQARAEITYIAKPFNSAPTTYKISGTMACSEK